MTCFLDILDILDIFSTLVFFYFLTTFYFLYLYFKHIYCYKLLIFLYSYIPIFIDSQTDTTRFFGTNFYFYIN